MLCLITDLVLQLYLLLLDVNVIPVDRSPPSLSSSLLSCAGTAVNLGPLLLRLHRFFKNINKEGSCLKKCDLKYRNEEKFYLVVALQS